MRKKGGMRRRNESPAVDFGKGVGWVGWWVSGAGERAGSGAAAQPASQPAPQRSQRSSGGCRAGLWAIAKGLGRAQWAVGLPCLPDAGAWLTPFTAVTRE